MVHNSEDFEQLFSIGPAGEAADGLVEKVGQGFIKIKSERESEVFTHEGEYIYNSLPIECFPLTYDLSDFKSRINRYLLTVGSF